MLNRDELKTVTMAVTPADTQVGTIVPLNYRRYIYRVRFISTINGSNILTLGKREDGAGATTIIDRFATILMNDTDTDPDELEENSAPLYTIEGPASNFGITPVGTSTVRALLSAGGTGFLTLWYVDSPA
jgi:hypothetical protein